MATRRQLAPVPLRSSTEVVVPGKLLQITSVFLTWSKEIDEYVRQKEATFITPDIIAAVEQGTYI